METLVIISLVLFTNAVSTSTSGNFTPRITKSPRNLNVVLVGNKVKLQWEFAFETAKELQRVVLFRYNYISKAKDTIAYKKSTSSSIQQNPRLIGRYLCEVYMDNNGGWRAWIVIPNIQFNYTGSYGIRLEPQQHNLPTVENSVSVEVVDMIAGDAKVLKTVRSLMGHKTSLKCRVHHRAESAPNFKWYKKSTNEIITEGIITTVNTSTLTFEHVNATDFGEYICEAATRMVSVKQNFLVVKLDYPRPPGVLRYEFCNETGSLTVSWTQASTEDRGRSRKYIVQIKEPPGEEWRSLSTTTKKLLVSLTGIKPKTKLRVCSSGEIGYDESSCSKPIDPVVPDKVHCPGGGKSSHFLPHQFLILAMVSLSSYKISS